MKTPEHIKCKDCHYWVRHNGKNKTYTAFEMPVTFSTYETYGRCYNTDKLNYDNDYSEPEIDDMLLCYESDCDLSRFITGQNFGCIHAINSMS